MALEYVHQDFLRIEGLLTPDGSGPFQGSSQGRRIVNRRR